MLSCNTGVSQNSSQTLWPIQRVGNIATVQPNEEELAGLWLISINSTQPYTIKVVGKINDLCMSFQ